MHLQDGPKQHQRIRKLKPLGGLSMLNHLKGVLLELRVVAAAGGEFAYGSAAGAAGCFDARLHHASVAPASPREHLKMAFFFRRSEKAERLLARPDRSVAELERVTRDDCGVCRFCLDMKKFGGANKLRQRCVERQY